MPDNKNNKKPDDDSSQLAHHIELNEGQRQILALAAMQQRKTVRQFILDAALEVAHQEIAKHSRGPCIEPFPKGSLPPPSIH